MENAPLTGAWQAWVFYGLFTGCGWGFLNLNVFSVAVLKSLPERYAGTAVGIANTGSTFGMFALVPAFSLLAQNHGWRAGYISLSGALLVTSLPAIALLRALRRLFACQLGRISSGEAGIDEATRQATQPLAVEHQRLPLHK